MPGSVPRTAEVLQHRTISGGTVMVNFMHNRNEEMRRLERTARPAGV